MKRPTRNDVLMQTAVVWSARSTCSRLQVGAVLSREGRILSVGYNGVPSGFADCDHTCDCEPDTWIPTHAVECHSRKPCDEAIHAEANAIAWAARDGHSTRGALMHVTHAPCVWCAKFIVNAGVVEVRYANSYRDDAGTKLLIKADIQCVSYQAIV